MTVRYDTHIMSSLINYCAIKLYLQYVYMCSVVTIVAWYGRDSDAASPIGRRFLAELAGREPAGRASRPVEEAGGMGSVPTLIYSGLRRRGRPTMSRISHLLPPL